MSATQAGHSSGAFPDELVWAQHVLEEDYKVVKELRSGDYFGERACMQGSLRSATVVSMKYSETLSLTKDALDGVTAMFPKGSAPAVTAEAALGTDSFQQITSAMHVSDVSAGSVHATSLFNAARMVPGGQWGSQPRVPGLQPLFGSIQEDSNDMQADHPIPFGELPAVSTQAPAPIGGSSDSTSLHASHALRRRSQSHEGRARNSSAVRNPTTPHTLARSAAVDMRGNRPDEEPEAGSCAFSNTRRSRLSFKLGPGERGGSLSDD